MQIDSSENMYEEVEISGGAVRVSYIEHGWDDSPSIRIQIRDDNGHLRQGPEIPAQNISDVISEIIELLRISNN